MTKNEIIKGYLRTRGLRVLDNAVNNLEKYKNDVYEPLTEEDIKKRVDAVEIMDLDKTVDDTGDKIKANGGIADPNDKKAWDDNSFKVLSEEDINEYGKSNE